jgi:hypothetical protein
LGKLGFTDCKIHRSSKKCDKGQSEDQSQPLLEAKPPATRLAAIYSSLKVSQMQPYSLHRVAWHPTPLLAAMAVAMVQHSSAIPFKMTGLVRFVLLAMLLAATYAVKPHIFMVVSAC